MDEPTWRYQQQAETGAASTMEISTIGIDPLCRSVSRRFKTQIYVQHQKALIFRRGDQIKGRDQSSWTQNAPNTSVFHESIANLLNS